MPGFYHDGTAQGIDISGFIKTTQITTGLTASSTQTQAGALALTGFVNIITTVAVTADAVKLPPAVTGHWLIVINRGALSMAIWPSSGDSIHTGAVDAVSASNLAAGGTRMYLAINDENWANI